MPQNFYELVWIFIIYAVIGWCTEVSYAALDTGKFVNRGFLNGPYCPVYGCGVVIVVAALTPLKDNFFILFFGSFLLTSVLEYLTGFILEKVFHNKWWDYSDKPFNLHGYICLKFSIYWGLACTFIMEVVHPAIYKCITAVPFILGVVILVIVMTAFTVDVCVTVATILKLNKRLKLMEEMAQKMHQLSDELGENIYEGVTTVIEKKEEFEDSHEEFLIKLSEEKEKLREMPGAAMERLAERTEKTKIKLTEARVAAKNRITEKTEAAKNTISESIMESKNEHDLRIAAKKKEYEELTQKYKELLSRKNFGFKRLMNAFPDMTSRNWGESLEKYKKYFNIKRSSEREDEENE